jgi:hypothetical protein
MKFTDLKFTENSIGGVGATHTFNNGIRISVQASEINYCTPRKNLKSKDDYVSFEVAIFDSNGDFITSKYISDAVDDVLGHQDRDAIDNLMVKIQEDSELIKALTYAVENEFITMSQAFEIIRNIK